MKQLTLTDRDIRLSRLYTQFPSLIRATGCSRRSGKSLTILCLNYLYVRPIGRQTCQVTRGHPDEGCVLSLAASGLHSSL